MNYFLNPGVSLDGFDPVFKTYFNKVFGEHKMDYNPTAPMKGHNGTFAMWTQTSPESGAWAFKFDSSNFNDTPYLAPLIKETLKNYRVEKLQYNKDIASAFGILAGTIPLFDNAKSGTKANQFAIDPSTLGKFMGKVKQGLGDEISAVAMPTNDTKFYQFEDKNPDMLDRQIQTATSTGVGASRVLYSSDKMSNLELQYAVENDYQTMRALYSQFNNFMNFFANKLTKKFHFKFVFDGCSYSFMQDRKFDHLMRLADKGLVLNSSAYASAMGMSPQDFERSLDEAHNSEFTEKLTMLLNANTMKNSGVGGRPRLDNQTITESGEASREDL